MSGRIPTLEQVIALDVGGTQIRAALCDRECEIERRANDLTPVREGRGAVMACIERAIRQVWPSKGSVVAIGVSAPGPLDPWSGVIHRAQNIPGWDDYPLRDVIQGRFGVPAVVGDDANVAALAEHRFGAGQGQPNLVYLTLSTGVGSGIIVSDRLLLGAHGLAGEAGCMVVEPCGPLCSCGNRGCLEALVSGPAIAREARRRLQRGEASSLLEMARGFSEAVTAKMVSEAAHAGDRVARNVLRQAGRYLGLGITNLLHIFDPNVVVIGGSVSKAGDFLLEPAREVIRQRCLTDRYWRETPLVLAALGDDVSLVGAASIAWDTFV